VRLDAAGCIMRTQPTLFDFLFDFLFDAFVTFDAFED
jgi:hypothetical protein